MQGPDRPDLVIVARGGGSVEDLWGFNEEVVVRAVASCSIPIISAVGHETDTSLCDFAADVRAPTPSAAAEIAVPVRAELLARLQTISGRALRCVQRYRERAGERLDATVRHLPTPETLLGPQSQRVDDLGDRLRRGLSHIVSEARGDLARATGALRPIMLTQRMTAAHNRLDQMWRVAASLNPDKILERGYARIERQTGGTITRAADAQAAGALRLRFADGSVNVRVEQDAGRAYEEAKPEQNDLF